MKNHRNTDLRSVRPAELYSAVDRQRVDNARRQRADCPAGRTGRMPMFRLPPIRMNAARQLNTAGHPEVAAATEGPLSRGHRHSSHVEASFESQATLARSLTSFGMTEGRTK